jgi:tetratricopeptide (TPR) repeat protein
MSSEAEATLIDRSPWKLRGRGHLPGIASIAVLLALTAVPIRSVLADSLDMQNCYKDDDQSFAACNTIIDDPTASQHDRSQALVGRGDSWDDVKHDHDRAVADYTQAIEIDPNNAVAFYNRGLTWIRKGDDQRAIADFDEAIRLDPKNANAFYDRGVVWREKGNINRAIADYDEAIRLNPEYENAYINRGLAWHDKGDDDRAIADYNAAIQLDPKYALAYTNRGNAWQAKGDTARANADFDAAKRLGQKE